MNNTKVNDIYKNSNFTKKLTVVIINLDEPPSTRWIPLINNKDIDYNVVIEYARSYADDIFEYYGFTRITESKSYIIILIKSIVFFIFSILAYNFTYYDDLIALSKIIRIHPGELFIGNILYECLAGCTSFICVNKDDKLRRLMHVRTLDWPFIKLNKHSLHFIYKKQNKIVSENIGWAGQLGFLTAVNSGHFSISLNARYPNYEPTFVSDLITKLILLFRHSDIKETTEEKEIVISLINSTVVSFLQKLYVLISFNAWTAGSIIRNVCERNLNYEDCVEFLSKTKTIGPCYFIVTGIKRNEGIIIEKGYNHLKIHRIHENNRFLIQTNDDIDIITDEIFNENNTTSSPIDFNSADRYYNTYEYLVERGGSLSLSEAASLITTSFKKGGVRMSMTLYCCVMLPYLYENSLIGVKSTRAVGGNG